MYHECARMHTGAVEREEKTWRHQKILLDRILGMAPAWAHSCTLPVAGAADRFLPLVGSTFAYRWTSRREGNAEGWAFPLISVPHLWMRIPSASLWTQQAEFQRPEFGKPPAKGGVHNLSIPGEKVRSRYSDNSDSQRNLAVRRDFLPSRKDLVYFMNTFQCDWFSASFARIGSMGTSQWVAPFYLFMWFKFRLSLPHGAPRWVTSIKTIQI